MDRILKINNHVMNLNFTMNQIVDKLRLGGNNINGFGTHGQHGTHSLQIIQDSLNDRFWCMSDFLLITIYKMTDPVENSIRALGNKKFALVSDYNGGDNEIHEIIIDIEQVKNDEIELQIGSKNYNINYLMRQIILLTDTTDKLIYEDLNIYIEGSKIAIQDIEGNR